MTTLWTFHVHILDEAFTNWIPHVCSTLYRTLWCLSVLMDSALLYWCLWLDLRPLVKYALFIQRFHWAVFLFLCVGRFLRKENMIWHWSTIEINQLEMSRLEVLWLVTNHEKIQKVLSRASDWAGDHVGMSRQPLYHHLLKFWTLETISFFVCTCGRLLPFRIALTLSETHSSPISKALVFVKVIGLQYTFGWSGIQIIESMFEIWCHDSLLVMWPKILFLCYKIGYVSRLMLICCLESEGLKSLSHRCARESSSANTPSEMHEDSMCL